MADPVAVPHRSKTQLAQLLSETLIAAAPHTAKIGADETRRQIDGWLDGFEVHAAGLVGPFLQQILDNSDPPEAIRALLQEGITPTAAFTGVIEQVFVFGIVSSIIGAAAQPFLVGVSNDLNTAAVKSGIARPVDLATIATAVGRGLNLGDPPTVNVPAWAVTQAAEQGIDEDTINLASSLIGLPPALQELFEMHRRGILPYTNPDGTVLTVEQGLKEGDFRDDWIAAVQGLIHAYLTPNDFVRAAVQEQLPYSDAETWAATTGLDTTTQIPGFSPPAGANNNMFGLAFAVNGRPPGPQELAHMTHRQIIPQAGQGADVTTFQQGIAESDIKTKWTDALYALSTYVPAPESVATLLERGGLTPAQAATYWAYSGVDAATIAALTYVTQQQHVSQEKLLAKGDIVKGYYDGIFTNAQATDMLGLLGYVGPVAAEILEVQDFRRQIRAIDQTVRKVGTLYEGFKLSATDALSTLAALGMSSTEQNALLGTWDLLRIAPVRVPTPTEIGRAVKAGTITEAEGLAELGNLGYQARDAAIVLSSESGAPVTPLPPAGTTTTG